MQSLTSLARPIQQPKLDFELATQRFRDLIAIGERGISEYVHDGGHGIRVLRHPLTVSMYDDRFEAHLTAHINRFAEKAIRLMTEGDPEGAISLLAAQYRLDALIRIECALTDEQLWQSAATAWQRVEWPSEQREKWEALFTCGRGQRELMMSEKEREALSSMPDVLTVWRGTIRSDKSSGMSWTLDKDRAQWFAKRTARLFDCLPSVRSRTVSKDQVVAYLAGRNEEEIILL